jgi:hypothetical protein
MGQRAVSLTAAIAVLLTLGCGNTAKTGDQAENPDPAGAKPRPIASTVGPWRVSVSVVPSRIGPAGFAVRDVARAKPTDSQSWVSHDLVLRNVGDRAITFDDNRSSQFVGDGGHHRLLIAVQGCGYTLDDPGGPVKAGACLAYLQRTTLEPGKSARRSITLFKGLAGMDPLTAGTYTFRQPVQFWTGHRPSGNPHPGVLTLTYSVRKR